MNSETGKENELRTGPWDSEHFQTRCLEIIPPVGFITGKHLMIFLKVWHKYKGESYTAKK
jgi:hypothetical protein